MVARGAPAIRAAQYATRTISIVMAGTSNAVEQRFVASLARPGGNITGLSWLGAELPGKGLELLKEIVPPSADRRAGESGQPRLWADASVAAMRIKTAVRIAEVISCISERLRDIVMGV